MNTLVAGNGLDSLIASYKLIRAGHTVTHFHNTNIAGHFAGIKTEHGHFDNGMVLLEEDDRGVTQKSLQYFNGEYGSEARKYLKFIYENISELFGKYSEHPVYTLTDDYQEIADYFISDCLDYLVKEESSWLRNEIEQYSKNMIKFSKGGLDIFHPSNKSSYPIEKQPYIHEYLMKCYGEAAYKKLFGSFLNALIGDKQIALPAKFHRKLWLPLYFPENLVDFSKNFNLSKIPFGSFENDSLAGKINKIKQFLFSHSSFSARIISGNIEDLATFEADAKLYFFSINDLSKLSTSQELTKLLPDINSKIVQTEQNVLKIVHFCVAKREKKTVFLQSPINGLYRYTFTDSDKINRSVATFEFGSGSPSSLQEMKRTAVDLIPNLDFICDGEIREMHFGARYLNMEREEWNSFVKIAKHVLTAPNTLVEISHPDGQSFNDNCLRGFSAAEAIGDLK